VSTSILVIISIVVTVIVAVPVTLALANSYNKKVGERKVGGAEEKAREIIDEAVKEAESKKEGSLTGSKGREP
jgi:ribonuclease Y